MKRSALPALCFAGMFCLSSANAQFSSDYQTNVISGVVSNWTGDYIVGNDTAFDLLVIENGGVLSNGLSYLGFNAFASNNSVVVSGSNSTWLASIVIGFSGWGNRLIITNGGKVIGGSATIGFKVSSSNNIVTVVGPDSVWSNSASYNNNLVVGEKGGNNRMHISNGAKVYSCGGNVGEYGSISNSVSITGTGSIWSNSGILFFGDDCAGNQLTITGGAAAYDFSGYLGTSANASNNTVTVDGSGSHWCNTSNLFIGFVGSDNRLTITNGATVCSFTAEIGDVGGSNTVIVTGAGSVWSNTLFLNVGTGGDSNQLKILDGGAVENGRANFGANYGSTLVSGIGSVWRNQGDVRIFGKSNQFDIADDASVIASNVYLSFSASSTGNVINLLAGSLIVTNGIVSVGHFGGGTMNVSNGTVTARDLIAGYTNGATGTISFSGQSTVNGRLWAGYSSGATGTIFITDANFICTNSVYVGARTGGTMLISNSISSLLGGVAVGEYQGGNGTLTAFDTEIKGPIVFVGDDTRTTGTVWLTRAHLTATNAPTYVGYFGCGSWTCSNTFANFATLTVSYGSDSSGTLSFSGGTLSARQIEAGYSGSGTGVVWICDGADVTATNDASFLGRSGIGALTVSNSTVRLAALTIVNFDVANCGTLTVAGGTVTLSGTLTTAAKSYSYMGTKASIWLDGGKLIATNAPSYIGLGGNGQMDISNGVYLATRVTVGGLGSTLTVAGGAADLSDSLFIGAADCSGSGTVAVAGGNLYVTNAAHTGTIEVRNGTLAITGGLLVADRIVMTNSCGRFIRTGGTLIYGDAVLNPSMDADGDGISNGWEQNHGLDPLDSADASADSDGDGQSNLAEFLAGTDPADSASAFHITSIAQEGADVRVAWQTGIGRTNALQAAGDFSNSFSDIFTVTNTIGVTTNYLDLGAATNFPTRFYRVRLLP